jgi:SAM-dependent methyltransferase
LIYGKYGEYYDLIYDGKNYDGECKNLIDYFRKFSEGRVRGILDMGCGTGNHAILFAKKGYSVVGIDSSQVMINQARRKVERKGLPVEFFVQDMRKLRLGKKFDAVLCLFGTFGYCINDVEILAILNRIRDHLKTGGLFIFDFFPVHAYIGRGSWRSVGETEKDGTYALRIMDGTFNLENQQVNLKIKCNIIKNKKLTDSFQEEHRLRTFTPPEVAHLLREVGFKRLGFFKVDWQARSPYSQEKVDLQTTNVSCVAKRVAQANSCF